ncbi:MAG TPA: S8 family peptidase [Herpetosiphonaceae bacterium]
MQRFIGLLMGVLLAIGALSSTSLAAAPAKLVPAANGKALANQYIVVLKTGANSRSVAAVAGINPQHVYESALNGFAATLNAGQLAALQHNPQVEYIEQDAEISFQSEQSDVSIQATQPVSGGQWGLDRIDQPSLPLNGTYNYTATGAGINAYIVSSGIYTAHPDFGGRATNVYDVTGGSGQDCYGLGSYVAGVVGGTTYGVAKNVNLRGVRYLDCRGFSTTANFIVAVDWLRANYVRPAVAFVMYSGAWGTAVDNAMRNLYNAGIFVAYPAGDAAVSICTGTTSYSSVYMVTASNQTDTRAVFANFGACVDVHAPGDGITSTWLNGSTNTLRTTLASAAHVTGCAAKYKQVYGDVPPSTLFSWLSANAVPGAAPGVKILYCPL